MNNDFMISLLATFGKYKIENSQLSRMEKEVWKFEVDLLEHFLKSINKQQFSNKKDIVTCAKENDLDKVVLVPYPTLNGKAMVVRMYGGNIKNFATTLGLNLLDENTTNKICDIDYYEKNFGQVVYLRENNHL